MHILSKLLSFKPAITLDTQGITDHISLYSTGLIPWNKIEALLINSESFHIQFKKGFSVISQAGLLAKIWIRIFNPSMNDLNINPYFIKFNQPHLISAIKQYCPNIPVYLPPTGHIYYHYQSLTDGAKARLIFFGLGSILLGLFFVSFLFFIKNDPTVLETLLILIPVTLGITFILYGVNNFIQVTGYKFLVSFRAGMLAIGVYCAVATLGLGSHVLQQALNFSKFIKTEGTVIDFRIHTDNQLHTRYDPVIQYTIPSNPSDIILDNFLDMTTPLVLALVTLSGSLYGFFIFTQKRDEWIIKFIKVSPKPQNTST